MLFRSVPFSQLNLLQPVKLYNADGSEYQVEWYKVYDSNQELKDWVQLNFPVEVELVEYIVSDQALPIHIDLGRNSAYNYLIDTGGHNLVTQFYSDDKTTIIDSCEYQVNRWYQLNVGIPHSVEGTQTHPRFLISVTPKSGITYKF